MLQAISLLILIFANRIDRILNRLLDRYVGVPAAPATPTVFDPMEGAKRVMMLFYAAALGGLSLIVFPKPVRPYIDVVPIEALSVLLVLAWLLFAVWSRSRRVRGLLLKPVENVALGLLIPFGILYVRAFVFSSRVT